MQSASFSPARSYPRACDVEPIQTPGSIQPHGLLLLFNANSESLVHWAGDFERLLGAEPHRGREAHELLGVPLHELIGSASQVAGREAAYVGSIKPPGRDALTAVVSRTGSSVSVELELAEYAGSIASALERVRAISDQIGSMQTLSNACHSAVEHVRAITGYDRVMVYQFLADDSGAVVAEARAPEAATYINHRFPASDIPAQARDLYRRNLIRVIPDVTYTPAPLCPGTGGARVDMSQCVLRSVSPVHLQYLKNMGVGASMSISLLVNSKLWGLIVCHHDNARHVSAETRLLCRHIGTTLSAFILSFGQAEDASRKAQNSTALEGILKTLRATSNPERTLQSSAEQLAGLVDCGGFALLANGEVIAGAGKLPSARQLRELAPLLEEKLVGRESFVTDRLTEDLTGARTTTSASGALVVSIEASCPLLALWVRPEQIEEISWAGDPHLKTVTTDPLRALTPRQSFATWRETVRGRSQSWTRHDVDTVELFRGRAELTIQRFRLKVLVKELGEANTMLSALATTDPLTGLANRRLFEERLAAAWQRSVREHSSVAVVVIDVDNFKKYNDQFGHPAGDQCLKQVAAAIDGGHRQVDLAARLGGEEFGLLLHDVDARGAAILAERVRLAVERLHLDHPMNNAGVVTISLGIAAGSTAHWGDQLRLVNAADQALYDAKAGGRNRVCTARTQTVN